MKQFMITLVAMFFISIASIGQTSPKQVAVANDSINNVTAADSSSYKTISADDCDDADFDSGFFHHMNGLSFHHDSKDLTIAIFALFCVFGMPVFIVFIILYFRHKNRKAKMKVIEKAIENGATIPENVLKEYEEECNGYSKGIRNIFVGIGFGIFMWALTGEFFLACIGILLICIGLGQVITHHVQKNERK